VLSTRYRPLLQSDSVYGTHQGATLDDKQHLAGLKSHYVPPVTNREHRHQLTKILNL